MSDTVKDQEMSKLKQLVAEKKFQDAYKYLEGLKLDEPILNFNLAYVKFYEGQPAQARALLEKIKYKGMFSKEVNSSLNFLKQELGIKNVELEYSKLDRSVIELASYPPFVIPSFSVFLTTVFLILVYKSKKLFAFLIFGITILSMVIYSMVYSFQVEINEQEVTIYKGPSKIFEQVQVLPVGTRIISTKESEGWRFIEYPSIFKGWVKDIRTIKQ